MRLWCPIFVAPCALAACTWGTAIRYRFGFSSSARLASVDATLTDPSRSKIKLGHCQVVFRRSFSAMARWSSAYSCASGRAASAKVDCSKARSSSTKAASSKRMCWAVSPPGTLQAARGRDSAEPGLPLFPDFDPYRYDFQTKQKFTKICRIHRNFRLGRQITWLYSHGRRGRLSEIANRISRTGHPARTPSERRTGFRLQRAAIAPGRSLPKARSKAGEGLWSGASQPARKRNLGRCEIQLGPPGLETGQYRIFELTAH